jgi:hypothetical protein
MITREEYIRLSLELNLFFGRIMKEHSIFMEAGFPGKNSDLAQQADGFKVQFEGLLTEAAALANGVISPDAVASGEFVTPYTLNAELVSQYYSGIAINTNISQVEAGLAGYSGAVPVQILEQRVYMLNQRAIALVSALIQYKTTILNDVLACRLFTFNYPLLIDHIMREAKLYLSTLNRLQNREDIGTVKDLLDQEIFWNRIMAEHSLFIRGLLDPTENDLINTANNFGNQFNELTKQAMAAIDQTALLPKVTADSTKATMAIRDFNSAAVQGLTGCKIKAIALPLLGDHVLRESNHFLRILKR